MLTEKFAVSWNEERNKKKKTRPEEAREEFEPWRGGIFRSFTDGTERNGKWSNRGRN